MQSFKQLKRDIIKYDLETYLTYDKLKIGMKYANGCGAKGGIKFPDTMWFVSVVAACIIHDIEWENANCYKDLLDANEHFDNNLKKITDYESINDFTRWFRRYRIASYTSGVELEGTPAYAKERGFELI